MERPKSEFFVRGTAVALSVLLLADVKAEAQAAGDSASSETIEDPHTDPETTSVNVADAWPRATAGADAVESQTTYSLSSHSDSAVAVEAILKSPLGDEAYRQQSPCLLTTQIEVVDVVDDQTLLFRGRTGTWINRLPKHCPGLRKDMMISMQVRSYRICTKQWFRGLERGGVSIPSSMCALGPFDAVDGQHVDRLTGALEARRRTTTVSRTLRSAGVVGR